MANMHKHNIQERSNQIANANPQGLFIEEKRKKIKYSLSALKNMPQCNWSLNRIISKPIYNEFWKKGKKSSARIGSNYCYLIA